MTQSPRPQEKNFLKYRCLHLAVTAFFVWSAVLFTACTREEKIKVREVVRPVKLMQVASSTDVIKRSYPGRVRAAKRVDLAFEVGGPLIELLADEGQEVQQDEVLARIDPRDFETSVRNAEGQLAKGMAALRSAQSEYDRIQRIRKRDPGAASESMVVKRREAVDTVLADIASLKASVEAAKNSLDDTYLRASFDGIVSRRYVENFQRVRPKEPIVSLDDIMRLEIIVDIPEILMAKLRKNGDSDIFAEFAAAPDEKYPLRVKEYSTRADAVTQTYQIVLEMDRPGDINILPGMTATVRAASSAETALSEKFILPAYALIPDENNNPQVWVVDTDKMTVHKREVLTGELVGNDNIEILDGIESGETIAVTGVTRLSEGMKIRDLSKIEGYAK